ncbi:MAG TPA: type II secretion system protein GspJ, partial [Bdellovibrionales bacterium]|nr:type II secretion system protein GspJ [Bdellovibrionales bacterium]
KVKKKIQDDIDREATVRNAMRLIEKDINTAFHYRDLNYEMKLEVQSQGQGGPPGQPTPLPTPPPAPGTEEAPPKKLTHFLGEENALHFTTLNHVRMRKDAKESDQAEVGYFLENCRNRVTDKSSQCLKRRTAPFIDEDVSKGGAETTLIENVTEFKLKYLGKGKEDWVTMWRTDERGDAVTKDNFPQAVQVLLTVKINERETSLESVFPIQFPNNKPEKKAENPQNPQSPQTPGQ